MQGQRTLFNLPKVVRLDTTAACFTPCQLANLKSQLLNEDTPTHDLLRALRTADCLRVGVADLLSSGLSVAVTTLAHRHPREHVSRLAASLEARWRREAEQTLFCHVPYDAQRALEAPEGAPLDAEEAGVVARAARRLEAEARRREQDALGLFDPFEESESDEGTRGGDVDFVLGRTRKEGRRAKSSGGQDGSVGPPAGGSGSEDAPGARPRRSRPGSALGGGAAPGPSSDPTPAETLAIRYAEGSMFRKTRAGAALGTDVSGSVDGKHYRQRRIEFGGTRREGCGAAGGGVEVVEDAPGAGVTPATGLGSLVPSDGVPPPPTAPGLSSSPAPVTAVDLSASDSGPVIVDPLLSGAKRRLSTAGLAQGQASKLRRQAILFSAGAGKLGVCKPRDGEHAGASKGMSGWPEEDDDETGLGEGPGEASGAPPPTAAADLTVKQIVGNAEGCPAVNASLSPSPSQEDGADGGSTGGHAGDERVDGGREDMPGGPRVLADDKQVAGGPGVDPSRSLASLPFGCGLHTSHEHALPPGTLPLGSAQDPPPDPRHRAGSALRGSLTAPRPAPPTVPPSRAAAPPLPTSPRPMPPPPQAPLLTSQPNPRGSWDLRGETSEEDDLLGVFDEDEPRPGCADRANFEAVPPTQATQGQVE